jgi:hypothetical protein
MKYFTKKMMRWIGVAIGAARRFVGKFRPLKVLTGVAGLIVLVWAVRSIAIKPEVHMAQLATVIKREASNLHRRITADQKTQKGVLESLASAWQPQEESPADPKKAAFDKRYHEAHEHPLYEVEQTDKDGFTITRYEIKDGYLVKTVYKGKIGWSPAGPKSGNLSELTISVQDKDMKSIGKAVTHVTELWFAIPIKNGELNTQELAQDLADRETEIVLHDENVRDHLRNLRERLAELQRRRAAHGE